MRYFRVYPWWLQMSLFVLMTFTLGSLCTFCLAALLPKMAGISLTDLFAINEHSPFGFIKLLVSVQGAMSMSLFLIPALLFAYFTHPNALGYVGLKKPANPAHLLLAIGLIMGAMPALLEIQALIGKINFGASVKASQEQSEAMMRTFLVAPTFADFLRTFTVIAIIPAVGEELFFRGVLMKFAFKGTKKIAAAVLFTSVVFAYTHSNVYGLVSIFLSGTILAYIYYLTSSIWCGILAHMCFNGTQVALSYFGNSNATIKAFANSDVIPLWLILAGLAVFAGSLFLLLKTKTPLTANWADDFDPPPTSAEPDNLA